MTDRSEPTTAAGRALLYALGRRSWSREAFRQSILAIEAEVRQPDSEALAAALERIANLPPYMSEFDARELYVEALGIARAALAALSSNVSEP